MDFEKLTSKSKELIQDVINLAAKEKHQYISPEHLLKSLLEDRQIIDLILKSGGSLSQIRRETDAELAKIPAVSGQSVQSMMSQDFTRVMMEAEKLADKANDKYVTLERILQALSMTDGTKAHAVLSNGGVNPVKLNQAINEYRKGRLADSETAEDVCRRHYRQGQRGQTGSGCRPRSRNPPDDSGSVTPYQKQSGAHRRAGRWQNRHCRGAGHAYRQRRRSGKSAS